jgi:hypothetical protein
MDTYSVLLRLRRITIEDAYIAVPVTDAVVKEIEDGTFRIDSDALIAEGIKIGQDPRVDWQVELEKTKMHPIQQPIPDGRKKLDTYYDNPIHE